MGQWVKKKKKTMKSKINQCQDDFYILSADSFLRRHKGFEANDK